MNNTTNIKKIIKENTTIYTNCLIEQFKKIEKIPENKINIADCNLTISDLIKLKNVVIENK